MRHTGILLAALVLACAGCSQPAAPTPAQKAAAHKAAVKAAAQKKLTMFHQMLAMKRGDLAVPIGQEIIDQYPHTQAAADMGMVLPGLRAKVTAKAEKRRLASLWLYQVSPMAGGTQSTASIKPSKPAGTGIELVLRRQSAWGTSAFLYDNTKGQHFVCHKLCAIVMDFDGHKHVYKGYLPKGGEPAMFIKEGKGFIKRLAKAHAVDMTITIAGNSKQTLEFETGGFDADKWQPLPKK